MIERFLTYLQAQHGASPNTVAAYRRDLLQWRRYMLGDRPECDFRPDDMTAADLRTWLASFGKDVAPTTRRRKLQALRSFYNWMMHTQGLTRNPAADITPPRMPKTLPPFVRPAETAGMLNTLEYDDGSDGTPQGEFLALRRRVILELFYATGVRTSELITLADADVDTLRGQMRVLGKGNKERIVPFSAAVATLIDQYRDARNALVGPTATLIATPDGEPLGRRSMYRVVHAAMEHAGVHASRLSPHVMRHSCATDLLNAGADLHSVSSLLGHASLATTQIYTHLTFSDLQHNYKQAHPRAKKS